MGTVLNGSHPARIAVISFFILVLELALIRLIPSSVTPISYFTNLLLFSAFFGLGLGCILWRLALPGSLFPAGLVLVFAFLVSTKGITIYDTGGAVHYWLQEADQEFQPLVRMPLALAALLAFVVSAIPFVSMGWWLSRSMQGHERLIAYRYDLLGSLLGTVAFAVVSYLGCPPWILVMLTAIAWGLLFQTGKLARALHVVAGLLFLGFAIGPYTWRWSPYYFVQYKQDPSRITVWVNASFHQEAINFATPQADFATVAADVASKFGTPYEIYRQQHGGALPRKVLILGAGPGNDVNVALMQGVAQITAVEIDPEIARIGRELHPMRPYDDPRVRLVIDDGRHFLWNAEERYDMVIFGTLDSQTLLSGQSNLRLDNYIYTTECFRDVWRVLEPGGMLATYYSVFKPWFYERIYSTVAAAFPGALRLMVMHDGYLFNAIILAGKELPGFGAIPAADRQLNTARPSTDDWPYIYLERPTISPLYLQVFALIGVLIASAFVLLRRLEPATRWHLDFLFLGVGFSLMESAAIVRLALAFGTTWVVSAVVFASVLLTVLLANELMERWPAFPAAVAWPALFACLGLNFILPVRVLLELPFALRVAGAAVLVGSPLFFAGICFSKLFRQQAQVGYPFGMNMIGAMAGGSIEYLSMLIGMRRIWLVLMLVYLLAWLSSRGGPRSSRRFGPVW
jgi:hypothetical protein